MKPEVSIIIPNFNGSRFLREAIDSALAVEGVSVEVIVIDDGSTDMSRKIIGQYGSRIRPIFQANAGAATARNVGLEMATAPLAKFLDSDDVLLPGAVKQQLLLRNERSHSSVRWINFGNCISLVEKNVLLEKPYYKDLAVGTVFELVDLVRRSPITSMPLHPVDLLREVGGFNQSLDCNDEYDLHLRLFFAGAHFVYDGVNTYAYRQHASAVRLSQSQLKEKSLAALFASYGSHVRLARERGEDAFSPEVKQAFAENYWHSGRWGLRSGHTQWANAFFDAARELSSAPMAGGKRYRSFCRLFGPRWAERFARLPHHLA